MLLNVSSKNIYSSGEIFLLFPIKEWIKCHIMKSFYPCREVKSNLFLDLHIVKN